LIFRLLAATCLVFLLLCEAGAAPAPQVLVKTKGKKGVPEQDTEKAWGARAVDPPEKDGQLLLLLPILGLKPVAAKEELPGASTQADAKDILSRFRNPRWGPEPDLDELYHPQPEGQGRAGPRSQILPRRQVLQGPEEDRDHIYHGV
ncbi:proline-rich acidic protein 1, partial [Ochotona curzoniae]|uniref:proline-rich acidic protein 1 n=1 Tax=Ochotona curzoniae TaxID=130825 RepID=UPI001B34D338